MVPIPAAGVTMDIYSTNPIKIHGTEPHPTVISIIKIA